jgi:hypothetical protein
MRMRMPLSRSPLLDTALAALEREARENPDAAVLWRIIEDSPPFCRSWGMLEVCNHFDGCVRSRPALMSVLLKELSAAWPVPLSLLN